MSVPELSTIFELSQHTIRNYLHRFNRAGLNGLQPDYGKGRPKALDWSKAQWLELLGQPPSQFELLQTDAQNWTQSLMADYLAAYHQVQPSQAAVSVMLKRVGVRWKRAKARVKSPDPLYVVKRERLEALKEKALRGMLTIRMLPIRLLMVPNQRCLYI